MIDVYTDEMQSKFGDNSIWVFEILRHVNRYRISDLILIFNLCVEALIEMKVCSFSTPMVLHNNRFYVFSQRQGLRPEQKHACFKESAQSNHKSF